MTPTYDAIIIGAGPAGSSAAILLARQGWRVALIEKQEFPRRKVCGECIAASNLPLLDALGIGAAVQALAGAPLREVVLMQGNRQVRAPLPRGADVRHPWGVALGRETLDTLLRNQARACGVTVFQPWSARAVDGSAGRFTCRIGRSDRADTVQDLTLCAPLLINAHGSWNLAPDEHKRPQRPADLFAFKANFIDADPHRGALPVLSFDGGYGGMVVGDRDTTTLAFCLRRDALARCRQDRPGDRAAEAALAFLARDCAGVRAMLDGARQHGPWLSVGPIRPGIRIGRDGAERGKGGEGGAFLIGNAAGEAHPIIGEGISMAIQSAFMLAAHLHRHRGAARDAFVQARLQRSYATEWRQRFAPRIRLAGLFAQLAMRPATTRLAWPLLVKYPELLTGAARRSGKVSGMAPV